jgi:hypothetical protein
MAVSTIDQSGLAQSQIISAVNMPTGSVIQTTQYTPSALAITPGNAVSNSATLTTSNTNIAFSFSITPQFTASKILIILKANVDNTTSGLEEYVTIFRGSTLLASSLWYRRVSGDEPQLYVINYLDSPASTSSVQYDCRVATAGGTGTLYFNRSANSTSSNAWATSTFVSMQEIR